MRGILVAFAALSLSAAALGQEGGAITVERSWARPAVAGGNGAAYMVIVNKGTAPDRLVGAASAVARTVEIHAATVDAQGVARMRPAQGVEIPPGGEARLAPGGLHVMLIGLARPLVEGAQAFPLTLTFERAGPITVAVAVERGPSRANGAGAGHGGHGSH